MSLISAGYLPPTAVPVQYKTAHKQVDPTPVRQYGNGVRRHCAYQNLNRDRPTVYPSADQRPSNVSSPAAPRRRRGWRWRRRWRHSPVMRRRRRRGRHPPMVAVAMMMVVRYHAAIHVSSGERGSGECDCGERRDEFDLVHGMVPFFVWGYVFRQIEAPISPPTSPPRSEAPISHQSSVWSVVL